MSKKLTKDEFIQRSIAVHGNKYGYDLVEYKSSREKVAILCHEHGVFFQTPNHHLLGHGCSKCYAARVGDMKRSNSDIFIAKARKIHGLFYDYSQVVYTTNSAKVIIICPQHGIFTQIPASHLSGRGCPKCAANINSKKLSATREEFVKKAIETHGAKYDYSQVVYRGNKNRVEIICKKHGPFYQTPNVHLLGHGCPNCVSSRGENCVQKFLEHSTIRYEKQKRFPGMKYRLPLAFDFFLPEYNTAIEYNGEQHYEAINSWGGLGKLTLTQRRDQIKRDYCAANGIKLIEIRYDENVEEKLKQLL